MNRALGLVLVVLTSCDRSFKPLLPLGAAPEKPALQATPAFAQVAPFEPLAIAVTGGVAPYVTALAPGGSSGSLSESSYVAGPNPLTRDEITVTDSAGNTSTIVVSVGAGLSVSPSLATTAPGGSVQLSASGGKPPYRFSLLSSTTQAAIDQVGSPGTELEFAL